jgi:sec-independent protein translocase protein TatA
MHFPSLPGLLVAMITGLLLFGAKRLPEMGASLGHGIREFRKSLQEIQEDPTDTDSRGARPSTATEPKQLASPTTASRNEGSS